MATTDFTDGVTLTAASWFDDVDRAVYSYLTAVAGTNTITATGSVTAALTAGNVFRFIPAATNTGATTLNITPSGGAALGAKNVFIDGAACVGGEIIINVPLLVMYDGTQFNILGSTRRLSIAQNSQSAAYTTVLADANKHILHPTADNNPRTFTIDSNANVPYPIGTVLLFVNQINTLTVAITSDTLTLLAAGTTGSRTVAANGALAALKVAATSWVCAGEGVS